MLLVFVAFGRGGTARLVAWNTERTRSLFDTVPPPHHAQLEDGEETSAPVSYLSLFDSVECMLGAQNLAQLMV